jgi:hypothetical protein
VTKYRLTTAEKKEGRKEGRKEEELNK